MRHIRLPFAYFLILNISICISFNATLCGKAKCCFTWPENCSNTLENPCQMAFTFSTNSNRSKVYFEFYSMVKEGYDSLYTAVGFSHDARKGGEPVLQCMYSKTVAKVGLSYNFGLRNEFIRSLPTFKLKSVFFTQERGFYCRVTAERKELVSLPLKNGKNFSFDAPYHLMLTSGKISDITKGAIKSHTVHLSQPTYPRTSSFPINILTDKMWPKIAKISTTEATKTTTSKKKERSKGLSNTEWFLAILFLVFSVVMILAVIIRMICVSSCVNGDKVVKIRLNNRVIEV